MIDVANAGGTKGKHSICVQFLIEKGRETYKMTVWMLADTPTVHVCFSYVGAPLYKDMQRWRQWQF